MAREVATEVQEEYSEDVCAALATAQESKVGWQTLMHPECSAWRVQQLLALQDLDLDCCRLRTVPLAALVLKGTLHGQQRALARTSVQGKHVSAGLERLSLRSNLLQEASQLQLMRSATSASLGRLLCAVLQTTACRADHGHECAALQQLVLRDNQVAQVTA